jgi:hypothetical protein
MALAVAESVPPFTLVKPSTATTGPNCGMYFIAAVTIAEVVAPRLTGLATASLKASRIC